MAGDDDMTEKYSGIRVLLRVLGPLLIVTGLGFMFVGTADFFSAFNSHTFRGPDKFWMNFVGIPLIGIGTWMTRYGYLRVAVGYVAGEVAPVGKDVINYLGQETQGTVEEVARAAGQGIAEALGHETAEKPCHKCQAMNDPDAAFCSSCGAALKKTKACPACGHANYDDAKFCDKCGRGLG